MLNLFNRLLLIFGIINCCLGAEIELLKDCSFELINQEYWSNPIVTKTELISDQYYEELGPRTGKYYLHLTNQNRGIFLEQELIIPHTASDYFNLSFWYWSLPGIDSESFVISIDQVGDWSIGGDISVMYQPYRIHQISFLNLWKQVSNEFGRKITIKIISNSSQSMFGIDDISLTYDNSSDNLINLIFLGIILVIAILFSFFAAYFIWTSRNCKFRRSGVF